jgi:thiol-disulfide isomerase/thioredoxin
MTKKTTIYIWLVLVVVLLVVGLAAKQQVQNQGQAGVFPAPDEETSAYLHSTFKEVIHLKPGLALPDVPITTASGTINFRDLKGPLLLNFWAVWCIPCIKELPSLEQLQKTNPNLPIRAVALDRNTDITYIQAFLDKNGIGDFAAYVTPMSTVTDAFSLRGVPTTLIIDGNGRVRYILAGEADWMAPEIQKFLNSLLENKQ